MKRILITGVAGFVGYHLTNFLKEKKMYEIYGTKLNFEKCDLEGIHIVDMDITKKEEVEHVISTIKPDYVYHLAAQSSVKLSWDNPSKTTEINVIGTINLLENLKKYVKDCKVLLIGSSEEYGKTFETNSSPTEDSLCIPENFYALTKNTQNQIGYLYAKAYHMNVVMTRSFNHIGIKQGPIFVVSDFCKQVAEIEKKISEPIIKVGNLSAYRDFSDVADIINGYYNLIEQGKPGNTYNIGSGKAYQIQDILNMIIEQSSVKIDIQIDENKYRNIDIKKTQANISKIVNDINYLPTKDIKDVIIEVLNYWRNEVK